MLLAGNMLMPSERECPLQKQLRGVFGEIALRVFHLHPDSVVGRILMRQIEGVFPEMVARGQGQLAVVIARAARPLGSEPVVKETVQAVGMLLAAAVNLRQK